MASFFREYVDGEMGVRLFFVISGFLITWLLLKEKAKNGFVNLRRFYIRRFLRIFPVYYFYLAFLVVSGWFMEYEIEPMVMVGSLLYLQNFNFWGSNWLVAHSWSLAVEEQFYLIWPWLFRRTGKVWKIVLPLVVLLTGSLARVIAYKFPGMANFLLLPFLKHVDFLLGGCYLAFFRFHKADTLRSLMNKVKGWWIVAGLAGVFLLTKLETDPVLDRFFLPFAGTIISLYFIILVAWVTDPAHATSLGCRLLNLSLINKIGILSYSLYVWQEFFLVPAYHPYAEKWWTHFPENVFFLIIAVQISYYIVEKPFLRIKDRFSAK